MEKTVIYGGLLLFLVASALISPYLPLPTDIMPVGMAIADILPKPIPENQFFVTSSSINAVGVTTESTSLIWQIADRGLPVDGNISYGSIAYATYSDSITTNGGQISEIKSFTMDTHSKTAGRFNVDTEKVLTYMSQNGSHLMGAESYVLDVAGNWSSDSSDARCVFSRPETDFFPAFCNKATASSKLNSVTTAQIETFGGVTAVSSSKNVPAALYYEISVTPDTNSASGYADGIIATTFTTSVMEGQTDEDDDVMQDVFDKLAAQITAIDTATVAGGISTFNKAFSYQSGIYCANC
jgi:6,7-dimethyl-8-ribityllumazine synthase